MDCEGRTMSSFFDKFKDIGADFGYNHFLQVISNLNAIGTISRKDAETSDKNEPEKNKVRQRDAHAPSSYETSDVYLVKKVKSCTSFCANVIYGSDVSPSSSPGGIASFIPSPFGSPSISRKGSLSSDSCEIRWDSLRVPTGILGLRTQLSTVPIGTKHFAVLCIPVPLSKRGPL